ncbi:MAG: ECF transporter S component [Clostridia bacterium]|nr:ECF transporter S component [Clostridia bacterium]
MLKSKIFSIIMLCVSVPAVVFAGFFLAKGKQYYLVSLLVIFLSLIPFFYSLEKKKLQTRELVITASVTAIAVASRAAFFYLPNIKPMCAVLVIAAVAFGSEFGFVCGALSMLLSNFIYGQGMWTPFQMLAMGLTVFVISMIIRRFKIANRFAAGIISGVICTVLYGVIVDLCSVFMMVSDYNLKSILAVYSSGVPFNLLHGLGTAVIVILFMPQITEKLQRIKIKYGIFNEKTERS